MYTVLIKNGMIFDGTGNPWFKGDVAIEGDSIKKIGKVPTKSSEKVIDAKGLAVSPGFIDPHTHFDLTLTLPNHTDLLEPYIRQGVTTFGIGNCGISAAPVKDETLEIMKGYLALITAGKPSWNWRSMDDYLSLLEKQGLAFNVAALVGQGAIRFSVMGAKDTKPTSEEMDQMKNLLRKTLDEGAFGMSTGLVYPPGMWSTTDELVELAMVLAEYGAVFTCHVRGSSETGIDSEKELITIARKTGVRVQHSHHEAFGQKFWGNVYETVWLDEEARREGIDIAFDVIPYTYVNTYLTAIFPPWALEGGYPKLIERLKDPEKRAKIRQNVMELIPIWPPWEPGRWPHNLIEATGWKNVGILSIPSGRKKDWIGKTLPELGKKLKKDPFDVAADLIIEEGAGVMAFYYGVTGERGLKFLLKHSLASGNSDAILTGTGVPHAAAYGTYPRIIGYYGRELGLYSIEEAVRKVTSSAARRFGLERRGIIESGMYADLVVFHPKRIIDKATIEKPDQYSEGIEYVIINGQIVFEKGVYHEKLRPGKVLRRT